MTFFLSCEAVYLDSGVHLAFTGMHHTKMDYDQQRILQYIKGLLTDQAEQKKYSETAQITLLSCVFFFVFFLMYGGGGCPQ